MDDRDAITAYALRRLPDPTFRERLRAVAADGSRPIITALASDPLPSIWDQVHALGDAANVLFPVGPIGNGFIILTMTLETVSDPDVAYQAPLKDDCTFGLFMARIMQDGALGTDVGYRLASHGTIEQARADLVGVAE